LEENSGSPDPFANFGFSDFPNKKKEEFEDGGEKKDI